MELNKIYDHQKEGNNKAIEALKRDFMTLRSGKVSTTILDNVKVDYYGNPTPLNQVGSVLATDATTITVSPWEKPLLGEIEKAIQSANIGVNPNNDGEVIKLFFPPMTTEQREENAKKAKGMGDHAKVSVRNVRQDANNKVKSLEKEKEITEDESKKAQDDIQKSTNDANAKIDTLVKEKEAELLKI
ncbi:MAG: ribosome recycling factor [Epsilonproteobacteria bacterium]|nr:ribosome recycling factor [Campylobacterota bacterium]